MTGAGHLAHRRVSLRPRRLDEQASLASSAKFAAAVKVHADCLQAEAALSTRRNFCAQVLRVAPYGLPTERVRTS
jgi:hypothetical protein